MRPGPVDAQKAQEPQTTRAPAAHIQVAAAWLPHRHVVSPSPVSSGEEKNKRVQFPLQPSFDSCGQHREVSPPPRAAGISLPIGHQLLGCRSAAASSEPPAHTRSHTGNEELPAGLTAFTLTCSDPFCEGHGAFPTPPSHPAAAARGECCRLQPLGSPGTSLDIQQLFQTAPNSLLPGNTWQFERGSDASGQPWAAQSCRHGLMLP